MDGTWWSTKPGRKPSVPAAVAEAAAEVAAVVGVTAADVAATVAAVAGAEAVAAGVAAIVVEIAATAAIAGKPVRGRQVCLPQVDRPARKAWFSIQIAAHLPAGRLAPLPEVLRGSCVSKPRFVSPS